jgi:hypothetical protein
MGGRVQGLAGGNLMKRRAIRRRSLRSLFRQPTAFMTRRFLNLNITHDFSSYFKSIKNH